MGRRLLVWMLLSLSLATMDRSGGSPTLARIVLVRLEIVVAYTDLVLVWSVVRKKFTGQMCLEHGSLAYTFFLVETAFWLALLELDMTRYSCVQRRIVESLGSITKASFVFLIIWGYLKSFLIKELGWPKLTWCYIIPIIIIFLQVYMFCFLKSHSSSQQALEKNDVINLFIQAILVVHLALMLYSIFLYWLREGEGMESRGCERERL